MPTSAPGDATRRRSAASARPRPGPAARLRSHTPHDAGLELGLGPALWVGLGLGLGLAWLASGCGAPGLAVRGHAAASASPQARDALSAPASGDASLSPGEGFSSSGDASPAPFDGAPVLAREALIAEVLRRSPTLESARQALRAALARPAQAGALDDPRLGAGVAPWSLGASAVDAGYSLEISQAFPFPGTLALREELAEAEAEAASHDYETTRLRIALLASRLFDDYHLAGRAAEIDARQIALLEQLQAVSLRRYEAGEASQQDPLQAETETALLEHDRIVRETDRRLAASRINALLHRSPDVPLPPHSVLDETPPEPLENETLLREALTARPELRAADARSTAGARAVELAQRDFLPDLGVFARYDRFWDERELRSVVGLEVEMPLQLDRRRAALAEARAELARAKSERARSEDTVRLDVVTAAERLREAHHLHALARERLVPAARDRAIAARATYETGQESFATWIDAERGRRTAELALETTLVNLSRRQAELERALGRLPGGAQGGRP